MAKGKLAVLTGQADEAYQSEFLTGLEKQAFEEGYDVCVFSMYIKYQNTLEREKGDSNIFTLVDYALFDAVIVMADSIQTPGLWKKIEIDIHERYSGPVIIVDRDSNYFKSFWTDGYSLIYAIISHLIEVHNYKDIAFLTGKSWHRHSKRRVEAYKEAMKDHGLPVSEDRIFSGDFWYSSGELCASSLLESGEPLPEAVACANDCMAIGLAKALTENGVRIPEDIAVTGYGSSLEGQTCPKPLTSSFIPSEYYGRYSVQCVMALLRGEELPEKKPEPEMFIGESCGCEGCKKDEKNLRPTWDTEDSVDGFNSIHNFLQEDILKENSTRGYLDVVYSYIFQIKGVKNFRLCLNEAGMQTGFSDRMLSAINYDVENEGKSSISIKDYHDRKSLFQSIVDEFDTPRAFFFTPIYFEDVTYGFAMISYGTEARSYDENYREWINAVSRGYEIIKRNEELVNLRSKISAARKTENKKTMEDLNESEKRLAAKVDKLLNQNLFKYFFQPIVSAKTGEIYSYEALMRSEMTDVNPLVILKYSEMMGRLDDVERDTFNNILSIMEENIDIIRNKKIFINSIPSVILEENERNDILKRLNRFHDNVVVEITESAEMDEGYFDEFKAGMKKNEIFLALDDYGTGYSNISNLLRYMPKYVKIDRSLITDIQKDLNKQYFVREIIDFCHESDILALAEGVENYLEMEMVIKLGVDLIQGFYTAKPSPEIIDSIDQMVINEILKVNADMDMRKGNNTYTSGRASWLSLNALGKEGYNRIVAVDSNVTYRDFTLAGTPGHQVEMVLEVHDGFFGNITLENASIFSAKNSPCIVLGENVDLTIVLKGDNLFKNGGILVPESSKLTIKGDGDLRIYLSTGKYFGIGNQVDKKCGEMVFHQDGEIVINASGRIGVGIGAGMGGDISVERGKYNINLTGEKGVGIGAIEGDVKMHIDSCDLKIDVSTHMGVCIGSIESDADLSFKYSSIIMQGNGEKFTACGTIDGKTGKIYFADGSFTASLRSPHSTIFGSLVGNTDFFFERGKLRADNFGENALIYGGADGDVHVRMENFDCKSVVRSELKKDTFASEEDFILINGSAEFEVNGDKISRQLRAF